MKPEMKKNRSVAPVSIHGGNFNAKRAKIQSWLLSSGWHISEQPENTLSAWVLTATNQNGHGVAIAQLRQPADLLVIEANVQFDEESRRKFAELTQEEWETAVFEAQTMIMQAGADFAGFDRSTGRFKVTQTIFEDGLTKDTFFQRIQQVVRGTLFTINVFSRKVGQPPQSDWQDNININ